MQEVIHGYSDPVRFEKGLDHNSRGQSIAKPVSFIFIHQSEDRTFPDTKGRFDISRFPREGRSIIWRIERKGFRSSSEQEKRGPSFRSKDSDFARTEKASEDESAGEVRKSLWENCQMSGRRGSVNESLLEIGPNALSPPPPRGSVPPPRVIPTLIANHFSPRQEGYYLSTLAEAPLHTPFTLLAFSVSLFMRLSERKYGGSFGSLQKY